MEPDWSNPCGVSYRWYDDGRFEVAGLGFPDHPQGGKQEGLLKRIWQDWGWYIVEASKASKIPASWIIAILSAESGGKRNSRSPCTASLCPALWKQGLCASQGGPNNFCAGGLMGFTQQAAKMYGHTVDWYFTDDESEGAQVFDGADLLVRKIATFKGEVLSGFKNYNGGKPCSDTGWAKGPGILNMYGQGDYIEKIVRMANTFSRMSWPDPVKHDIPEPVTPKPPVPLLVGPSAPVVTSVAVLLAVGGVFATTYYWNDIGRWIEKKRQSAVQGKARRR